MVYGHQREPKAFFEFGERALMKKHLDRLIRSGRVYQEGDRYIKKVVGKCEVAKAVEIR
jgi:hypothetical protein